LLSANTQNADAHVMLGVIRQIQKKSAEAEAEFKLAVQGQPTNPIGYATLSKHYLAEQKIAEAEAALRSGLAKIPNDFSLNLALAGILEMKNDFGGAITLYDEQLKRTPDAMIVVNNLSSLLADHRSDKDSLEKARVLSQRLTAIDVPQFKDTVGWIAYRNGDFRTALLNLESAAEKLPENALVRYHLAMTYAALKRTSDARDELQKADAMLELGDPLKEKINASLASLPATN